MREEALAEDMQHRQIETKRLSAIQEAQNDVLNSQQNIINETYNETKSQNILTNANLNENNIEEFSFFGLFHSSQNATSANTADDSQSSIGVRYGQQTLDWRTMLSYSKNGEDLKLISAEIDKILMDNLLDFTRLRPYVGLSIGSISYTNTKNSKDSGYFYGINAGVIIYATDNIDADISYYYLKSQGMESLDSIDGANMSMHYFF